MIQTIEALLGAYLIAGAVQYLKLLWGAAVLRRYANSAQIGTVVQRRLFKMKPTIVLGVIATWPIATWRALRAGGLARRLGLAEPVLFAVFFLLLA